MAKKNIEEGAADAAPFSPEAFGADYFKTNPDCPTDSIYVCSDGVVFYNTPKGENSLANYLKSKEGITSTLVNK